MKNISRIIVALAVILISVSITSIPVKAETAAEKWLRQKREEKERYMGNGLFKEESANFITQLKKRDKINSYAFSIKYNND